MKEITTDLIAEQAQLDVVIDRLTEREWALPTPAVGWSIKDTITHIAYWDGVALALITGAAASAREAIATTEFDELNRSKAEMALKPAEVLAWWRQVRTTMAAEFLKCDPRARYSWDLPMSARSLATARLMELWAHGLDCLDTLDRQPVLTDRIKHVLFLAWQARPYAYHAHGVEMPATPLRLELTLPSGALWTQGPEDATNVIRGEAGEFARVAVRRGHWMDTDLVVAGEEARRYAEIVQTYAGPPGDGRKPHRTR